MVHADPQQCDLNPQTPSGSLCIIPLLCPVDQMKPLKSGIVDDKQRRCPNKGLVRARDEVWVRVICSTSSHLLHHEGAP